MLNSKSGLGVGPFSRRGVSLYGSGRFNTSPRLRKQTNFLSFRSTRRQTPRPIRAKEVFDRLLKSLEEGISELKVYCEKKRKEMPDSVAGVEGTKMMTNYMDQEKMMKSLERRIRTLEVHKDKVDEMRDEYELKLKLREGAFNLASALSTQPGKASKEKLAEARAEQKELLEDLCDIEDELDTKLGVFRVLVEGIKGPTKLSTGDTYELQLRLSNQKWKARCRVEKHHQLWQDNEIIFIGRIADELSIKLVEVKKIQADSSIGTAKWRTREMLSFFPQAVTVMFQSPSGTVHLGMKIRWSPTIEDDFLAELDLPTVDLVVGGSKRRAKRTSNTPGVQKVNGDVENKVSTGTLNSRSGSLLSVKRAVDLEEEHRKWAEEQSRAYRRASSGGKVQKPNSTEGGIVNGSHHVGGSPHFDRTTSGSKLNHPVIKKNISATVIAEEGSSHEFSSSHRLKSSGPPLAGKPSPPREGSYSGSVGKRYSYETAISLSSTPSNEYPDSLVSAIEAVNQSLEEPKVVYADLRALEFQLLRLEGFIRGAKIHRTESMTLSESVAIDSFSFLTIEDNPSDPSSQQSVEGVSPVTMEQRSSREGSLESSGTQVTRGDVLREPLESLDKRVLSGSQTGDSAFSSEGDDPKLSPSATTGVGAIDKALTQHLIYSDHLLQDLLQQSLSVSGPLNYKLKRNLSKLRKEAEIIKDLLNMAVDLYAPPNLEEANSGSTVERWGSQ